MLLGEPPPPLSHRRDGGLPHTHQQRDGDGHQHFLRDGAQGGCAPSVAHPSRGLAARGEAKRCLTTDKDHDLISNKFLSSQLRLRFLQMCHSHTFRRGYGSGARPRAASEPPLPSYPATSGVPVVTGGRIYAAAVVCPCPPFPGFMGAVTIPTKRSLESILKTFAVWLSLTFSGFHGRSRPNHK